MKNLLLLLSFCTVLFSTESVGQYDIDIKVKNYENDTLIVGYYHGDKQLVKDTLISTQKGEFSFSGQDTLINGIYILLTTPDNEYIQFHVNEGDTKFSMEYDLDDKVHIKFKGTKYNEVFQDYVDQITESRPRAIVLSDTIKALKEMDKDFAVFKEELDSIDEKVKKKQKKIFDHDPKSVASLMLKANEEIEVPEFSDAADIQTARFNYYKKHFFDNMDLSNPVMLNIGVLGPKVDTYLSKLTSNHPDSITNSIDVLLNKMEAAPNTYKFYLSSLLNKYASSKIIGYDAIFVNMIDNYYAKGKAPWVSEENMAKLIDNANKARPALIGKIGADIKVFKEDGVTPISISDIDYEYLVLLFWAPDCGHCTKMMPKFVEFNETWSPKGIKTFAICSKHMDKTVTCWEALEDKKMLGFINAADQRHTSRFKMKYNVTSTPKVYILDKKREILMKGIGSDQLEQVMLEVLKKEKREDLIPASVKLKKEEEEKVKEDSSEH